MARPPKLSISFEELPTDPQERHEALVDAFGQYMFWARRETISRASQLVESREARDELGRFFRDVYEQTSRLGAEDRKTIVALAEDTVGFFARLFLSMISGSGFDDSIGPSHVLRFRLDLEICDAETGEVVLSETINRNGKKFFPDYWGRWLNRYSSP